MEPNKVRIRYTVIFIALIIYLGDSHTVKSGVKIHSFIKQETTDSVLTAGRIKEIVQKIDKIHPNLYSYYPKDSLMELISKLENRLPKDKLKNTDVIFHSRYLFDSITKGDPHFKMIPTFNGKGGLKVKDIKVPPFSLINISNELIVDFSFSALIQKGDLILKINGISSKEYLTYNYPDRYIDSPTLLAYYHYSYAKEYKLLIVRNNEELNLKVKGIPVKKYFRNADCLNTRIYKKSRVAYFEIKEFKNNKELIAELKSFNNKINSVGIKDVVIDLRRNPGGSGEYFDKLLSLFTNKGSIKYQKRCSVKVSNSTLDYGFRKDQIGEIHPLNDSLVYRSVELHPTFYLGDYNYYFLVSNYTSSMAASFVNTIQFNKIGMLVGEPLAYNALRFGETIMANFRGTVISISTMEMEDFSISNDGIVRPDVYIPFVANDFNKGDDPIVKGCIDYIVRNRTVRK